MSTEQIPMARRQALVCAGLAMGAGALVACASNTDEPPAGSTDEPAAAGNTDEPAAAGNTDEPAAAGNTDEPAAAGNGEPEVLAAAADVPVGSALIVDGIVLTQPKAGEYIGLSAVCPHAGCAVSKVNGAEVSCPCHGSTFGLDGAVISGPARDPLAPAAITVRGDSIVAG